MSTHGCSVRKSPIRDVLIKSLDVIWMHMKVLSNLRIKNDVFSKSFDT